jgi:hypothetical protein
MEHGPPYPTGEHDVPVGISQVAEIILFVPELKIIMKPVREGEGADLPGAVDRIVQVLVLPEP